MKRQLFKALAIIVSAFLLVGCTPRLNNPETNYDVNLDVVSNYEVEGTLKVGITSVYTERWLIDALIEEYNQVYPNVEVKVDEVQGAYNNTLVGYWQAEQNTPGIMPDILVSNSTDMHSIIENGILLDLQKYVDESVKAGLLDLSDFHEDYWKLGQENFNGDQYVLPRSADRVVTHLNQTLFETIFKDYSDDELPFTPIEGTKVPANGWTWQEFMDTCEVIRKWYDDNGRKEQYLVDAYFDWEPIFNAIFRSEGAELIDKDQNVLVDTPEVKKSVELMNECIEKRYVAPPGTSVQGNYEGGQGIMLFNSAYAQRFYTSLTIDQQYDYNLTTFPLINGEEGPSYIGAGVAGYAMASTSRNKDLAWTFLLFMLSKDGQNALASGGMTTLPIRKDLEDPATNVWGKNLMDKGINMSAYTYGTERCVITDYYLNTGKPNIYNDLMTRVSEMLNTSLGRDEATRSQKIAECQEYLEYLIESAR